MAERAHPDIDGFSSPWTFRLRRGFIPWISYTRKPYRSELMRRYKWVNRLCKGKRVLDVPCGMGWGTSLLRSAKERIGVDLSADAIQVAQLRYGLSCQFHIGSMERLPIKSTSIDIVACLEGIEHVPIVTARLFISEAARVLRDNGILMVSSPYCKNGQHSGNPYHIYEYQPEEILGLLETSFDVQKQKETCVNNVSILYILATKK